MALVLVLARLLRSVMAVSTRVIILEGPQGRREIPEGPDGMARFRKLPGERVIGSEIRVQGLLQQARSSEGLGIGELVAWVTHKVGIKPCTPCNRRRKRLNEYRIKL